MSTEKKLDLTQPIQLKKPAKHGDQITFEDYVGNMTTIEDWLNLYKYAGLIVNGKDETQATSETFIPFKNVLVETDTINPNRVILQDKASTIKLINELRDTIFDTKYTLTLPANSGVTTLPTATELNAEYDNPDDGIPAIDLDGNVLLLKRVAKGDETVPVKQMANGEGLLIIIEATGVFEEAGFTNDQWVIDQTKNELPKQLIDLDARIAINESDIADHDFEIGVINTKNSAQDTRLETLESADLLNLKTANDKSVSGFGALTTDGSVTEGDKLAIRSEIASPLASLQQTISSNKGDADAIATKVTGLEPIITSNESGVSDYFDNKSNFALVSDIMSTNQKDLTSLNWVDDNGTLRLDLSGIDLSGFRQNDKAEIKTRNGNDVDGYGTIFVWDSYDDISGTTNEIHVGGNDQSTFVTISSQEATITGVGNGQRQWFVDGIPSYIQQIGATSGSDTDQTARDAAAAAQSTANTADGKSVTNAASIIINKDAIALKQDITDASLTTTEKEIPKAINELKTRSDNNESDILELNKGKFDIANDDNITEIFDADKTFNATVNTDAYEELWTGVVTPAGSALTNPASPLPIDSFDETDEQALQFIEEDTNEIGGA